jgi:hypothetical protein
MNIAFNFITRLLVLFVAVGGLLTIHPGTANAALITCGSIQIESNASCLISGSYQTNALPAVFTAGANSAQISGGGGNTNISLFNGVNPGGAICGGPFQTIGDFGSECGASYTATSNYLIYVFETGGGTARQFVIGLATGAALAAGIDYQEGTSSGTAKFNIYKLTDANVPLPGTVLLLATGLFALRRRLFA